MDELARPAI